VSERAAREAREVEAEPTPSESRTVSPSAVVALQRSAGNAAVARLLAIGDSDVTAERITKQSRYKRRLNVVISREARRSGLTPDAVRQELVQMTGSGTHEFATPTEAAREAVRRIKKPGPADDLPVRTLVRRALADLTGEALSQTVILERLEAAFGDKKRLHKASKDPEFAEALLEAVRTKQSKSWTQATKVHQAKPATWTNDEMQHWSARHYTSKFQVVLGKDLGEGIFEVQGVEPPPFSELLSSITLATMDRGGATATTASKPGDKLMLTFTSGAATSGHTTGVDWKNIGNVGDTFYGLFYKEEPATGVTPAFIRDAVYYATWPVSEFGEGWASADWLGTAAESQSEGAKVPEGKARQGDLSDVIADIFPEAATRDFSADGGKESAESRSARREKFNAMPNFEVKKHGPMTVKAWLPVNENIEKIKEWRVDTKSGKLVKLDTKLERSEDSPAWALLKYARQLGVVTYELKDREETYTWGSHTIKSEAELEKDTGLFDTLKEAVEKEKLRLSEEASTTQPLIAAPPPPPPPSMGNKTSGVGSGGKKSN
jgi:hypothetical protein